MIDKLDPAILGAIRPHKTLASEWEELREMVFAAGAWEQLDAVQQREMKRAFYAGAAATMALVTPHANDDPAGVRYLLTLHQEIAAFAEEIGQGGA